jgi:hypothetical protein
MKYRIIESRGIKKEQFSRRFFTGYHTVNNTKIGYAAKAIPGKRKR